MSGYNHGMLYALLLLRLKDVGIDDMYARIVVRKLERFAAGKMDKREQAVLVGDLRRCQEFRKISGINFND